MAFVWYFLIHVSLGLIGKDYFLFTNLGAIYAAAAGCIVQGYAMWELHRQAWPMFQSSLDPAMGQVGIAEAKRGYWNRIGRTFIFRLSAYSILTLLVAAVARGA